MNGLGTNGFSWRNTGSPAGGLGAAVLALNTTGLSNIRVSWTGGTVDIQNERQYRIRLQYRVGTSGSFTDVPGPVEYTSATIGHSQDFGPTLLPVTVNNQPVVQLRWKYYYVSGSGNRPQLRVGNILVEHDQGGMIGDGTGSASVQPNLVSANRVVDSLIFSFRQDSNYTVTSLSINVPPFWSWSHDTSSVLLSGPAFAAASTSISGDTIKINQAALMVSDSGRMIITNLTSPDTGGYSTFTVRTAVDSGTLTPIVLQPRVRVIKLVPIVLVHVNDSQGVPAPPYQLGAEVTVTGVVTWNRSSTQTNVFVQDETAGINIFSFDTLSMPLVPGDSITVTGTILQFRGLTEISPEFALLQRHASGRPIPEPMVLTCANVNNTFQPDFTEPNESRLIRINGVTYNQVNSTITDATGTTGIFIPNTFPPVPTVFDVIGVLTQFKPGTPAPGPPFTSDYEIVPRTPDDIVAHPGPIITSVLPEDNIQPTSVRLQWLTNVPSSSIVRYGITPMFGDSVFDATPALSHSITLSGLTSATVYYYSVGSGDTNGTNFSQTYIFSTSSPPAATGQVNVYFNRSVNTSVSIGEPALGNQDLVSRLATRINNAQRSIDMAMYNMSGPPGSAITTALVNAKNRGVKIRVICEYDNRSNFDQLVFNGIPLINDRFDAINDGAGFMHNKFFVFDYRGGAPESIWVWTGSWNLTPAQTTTDHQNAIEVQDVSLAGAYTLEFNEMWGSDTDIPNASNSRFGARKRDNTPHRFVIAGQPVESYFSPSDRTTTQVKNTLRRSSADVAFALFSFTRRDIADTLIARKNAGKRVRGVMDSNVDPEQFNYLTANAIDVKLEPTATLLHHKYAIVDGTRGSSGPNWAITGSANWSNNAENSNNENILIVQSSRVANLYLQEFAARYYEAGGTDSILVSVQEGNELPKAYSLSQNYPNPFNPSTAIGFQLPVAGFVTLKVYNLLGQDVATVLNEERKAGRYTIEFHPNNLATGVYLYRLQAGTFNETKKMLFLK